nr:MAG TPA: hypothetical protein [Caudoviricetes sp.]
MADAVEQIFCERCHKVMNAKEFYGSNNLEKYPDGKIHICKKCLTMHVDNWDPETYLWILQECDVPYIPDVWNKIMDKYGRDKSKVTGVTIIGRYLSTMKIKQYKDYRWKDTEYLQEKANRIKSEAMKRQGFSAAEIDKTITEDTFVLPQGELKEPAFAAPAPVSAEAEDYFDRDNDDETLIENDLTDENKRYLRLKWGKAYKPEEWVRLEQLYQKMTQSYDIQGAGHEDVLLLVCKTSLKANQLLDIGDVDGAQKMIKMYDSLMKSGKFTAAQNKADNGEFLDSISEFVVLCEKEGFIPRYYVDGPKDKVDETIADLKGYTRSLVVEEMNLGNLIENAVKQMAQEEAKEEDEDVDDEELTLEEIETLKDEDFEAFDDFVEDEAETDQQLMDALSQGEEV